MVISINLVFNNLVFIYLDVNKIQWKGLEEFRGWEEFFQVDIFQVSLSNILGFYIIFGKIRLVINSIG